MLEKSRNSLFAEEMSLLDTLKVNSHFTRHESSIGGEFPRSIYDGIISEVQNYLDQYGFDSSHNKGPL